MKNSKTEEFDAAKEVEKLKKETVEKFINGKLSSAELLDTQKGAVAEWLKEAIEQGYELGLQSTIANDPDMKDAMKDFVKKFVNGNIPSGNETLELYKSLFKTQRMISLSLQNIISEQSSQVGMLLYELMTPEEKERMTCFGLVGR